jgi:hypothetical protein
MNGTFTSYAAVLMMPEGQVAKPPGSTTTLAIRGAPVKAFRQVSAGMGRKRVRHFLLRVRRLVDLARALGACEAMS